MLLTLHHTDVGCRVRIRQGAEVLSEMAVCVGNDLDHRRQLGSEIPSFAVRWERHLLCHQAYRLPSQGGLTLYIAHRFPVGLMASRGMPRVPRNHPAWSLGNLECSEDDAGIEPSEREVSVEQEIEAIRAAVNAGVISADEGHRFIGDLDGGAEHERRLQERELQPEKVTCPHCDGAGKVDAPKPSTGPSTLRRRRIARTKGEGDSPAPVERSGVPGNRRGE